jgi:hypothetical protein
MSGSTERSRSRLATVAMWVNGAVGSLGVLLGGLFALMWLFPGEDPHGGMYSLVLALWTLPPGALFLLASAAYQRRWRSWWFFQAVPVLCAIRLPQLIP